MEEYYIFCMERGDMIGFIEKRNFESTERVDDYVHKLNFSHHPSLHFFYEDAKDGKELESRIHEYTKIHPYRRDFAPIDEVYPLKKKKC